MSVCPVVAPIAVSDWLQAVEVGQRRSGRDVKVSDAAEHGKQRVVPRRQPHGQDTAVTDQPGGHAEQLVP